MMQEPSRPHITVIERDGAHVVQFADRKILDELAINEIREELEQVASEVGSGTLILSFKSVEYLSSAALGVLVELHKHVSERNGKLKLAEINPQIYEVFKITRLYKILDIYNTTEDAIGAA